MLGSSAVTPSMSVSTTTSALRGEKVTEVRLFRLFVVVPVTAG